MGIHCKLFKEFLVWNQCICQLTYEETAVAPNWVTDGVDRCRVGFLPKFQAKHWKKYEGRLAQVTEFYRGK